MSTVPPTADRTGVDTSVVLLREELQQLLRDETELTRRHQHACRTGDQQMSHVYASALRRAQTAKGEVLCRLRAAERLSAQLRHPANVHQPPAQLEAADHTAAAAANGQPCPQHLPLAVPR